jgi:hypothetical protein
MEAAIVFVAFMLGVVAGMLLGSQKAKAARVDGIANKSPGELELSPVQLIKLQDDSVAVIRAPGKISAEQAERIRESWDKLAPSTKCLVLDGGLSLSCVLDKSTK